MVDHVVTLCFELANDPFVLRGRLCMSGFQCVIYLRMNFVQATLCHESAVVVSALVIVLSIHVVQEQYLLSYSARLDR
jgi:hypothetical protein